MSRHDYTKHSKKIQNEVEEGLEFESIEPSEEDKIEAVAESKPSEETVSEPEIKAEAPQPVESKSYDLGVVTGCAKLRVRSEPRFGTNVVCEIDKGTRVMIDKEQSTNEYYKIFTESGIEGFCVKTYIA